MKDKLKYALIFTASLYGPFIIIVRDPFSPWWHWFAIPGWPLQIIHSNKIFVLIGGTIFSFILIGVLTFLSGASSKRFYLLSLLALIYAVGSALFAQWAIHAG